MNGPQAIRTATETGDEYRNAVAAESRALQSTARKVALGIADWFNETASDGHATIRNAVPADTLHAGAVRSRLADNQDVAAQTPLLESRDGRY